VSGSPKEDKHARLLDEIEAFMRNGPPLQEEPAKPGVARQRLAFPDLNQPPPEKRSKAVQAASRAFAAALPEGAGANSLLARLKSQAHDMLRTSAQTAAEDEARAQYLSACMGVAFHYLDDLVKQLNVVKPAIPKEFLAPGGILFAGMHWVEGTADYRMVPSATEDRLYESLYVRLRIAAPGPLRFERQDLATETLRKQLHDYNIAYHLEEIRDQRNRVERGIFTLPREVKAGLMFKADYPNDNVILNTRNIERFGMMEFRLRPDDLHQETLDELVRLMLGEPSQFLKRFRRTA